MHLLINIFVKGRDREYLVPRGPSRRRNLDIEVIPVGVLLRILIKQSTAQPHRLNQVLSIRRIFRILPVDIQPIQSQIGNQLQRRLSEAVPRSIGGQRSLEVVAERPSTHREGSLEIAVLLLELVELVEVAVELCSIRGHVARVLVLQVCPDVGEENFSSDRADIREGVGDLGQLFSREIGDEVLSGVDGLFLLVTKRIGYEACLTQFT